MSATQGGSDLTSELEHCLRRSGIDEVDTDARRRAEYSSDASLYRVPPRAVAFPRDGSDIEAAVEVARTMGVPITPRGAGTSIAGNAVGPGIVLDTRRHMSKILEVDPTSRTARVEPGVVLDDLQVAAGRHGLRFGPDPSSHDRCTLGGMIGNNACGSRALGYGRTVDHVLALDVVTGTGERVRLESRPSQSSPAIIETVTHALSGYRHAIEHELDRFTRQVSGYALHEIFRDAPAKALVGSEGTCAITVEAELSLVPDPPVRALAVLGYEDMAAAADAVPPLLDHMLSALEGLDSRIVDVVRQRRGTSALPDLPPGGGWLFAEVAGEDAAEVTARARRLADGAQCRGHRVVTDPAEMKALWRIREDGSGLVARSGPRPAHAGWEDAAVPPERLGDYLRDFDALLLSHDLIGVPYGHFGDGCVHVRIDFPLDEAVGPATFRRFLFDAARLVASHGGSISGEHGDGRARSELLAEMYPPHILEAFAVFKGVFDPDEILNPGVLTRPQPVDANLRSLPTIDDADVDGFGFGHDQGSFARAVHRCTGVGKCVSTQHGPGRVMCPSYLATGDERDSTRGRARVLQEMVDGRLLEGGASDPAVHDALKLCLACKGCLSDCPTGVDMATYKAEVLHRTFRGRLRPRTHYTLGRIPLLARIASAAPTIANAIARTPFIGGLLRTLAGVDERRGLPELASRARQRRLRDAAARALPSPPRGSPTALLWIDTFTHRFSPETGVAALRVLRDAGYAVEVAEDLCCGVPLISTGQLDAARRRLSRTITRLHRTAADGGVIVGLEPSCTAVLRGEAPDLVGTDAARRVAAATRTLSEALTARRPHWRPPDLTGVQVVAQPHCHHHAVMGWAADERLLRAAGASVEIVGGCCGLAGNFGMEQGNYAVSQTIAETALLPAVNRFPHATVLADGFSCRTQLAEFGDRPGRHLAELLADHLGESAGQPGPGS
ncbi:FAD-binding and (Fe-S)-binding domain-containing protein [Egicoccus halophilus]|uniref:Lactate dehydrogenase n=1 Tax=Egicoccus halophilus TaxID=1670830 RepID=A0A8J3ABK0_9ACTN|nr:FAD-binding and (Fe-S)-binding domain-containing protein [Egicoccus halophilus]GGI02418.1 lactate dehydrogenase [Egicoccus halophilus]